MLCPVCGCKVGAHQAVCPACHAKLKEVRPSQTVGERWCVSCGSLVPGGLSSCPQCGMPVEGFEEDVRSPIHVPTPDDTGFVSAIPPVPTDGDETQTPAEVRHRRRLLGVAAAAAVLLVGGTTLYITRPWDPDAYAIHSFVDADTSWDGYPGYLTHLTGQDKVEGQELKDFLAQVSSAMDTYEQRLPELQGRADALVADLERYFSGELVSVDDVVSDAHAMARGFVTEYEALANLDLTGTDLEERQARLTLLGGYLAGELKTIDAAATAISQADVRDIGVANARACLASGEQGRSLDGWRELFLNALATY